MEEDEKIKMKRVYFDSTIQARDAYCAGRCDNYVTDGVAAAGQRAKVAKNPDKHDIIVVGHAAEPNGVAIARGDDQMFDIVRWTWNLLVWAEEHGITQKTSTKNSKQKTKKSGVFWVLPMMVSASRVSTLPRRSQQGAPKT